MAEPGAKHMSVGLAHAKINLALAVGSAEPATAEKPGWHRIASWMHAIDLCDEVTVAPAAASSFTIAWADDAPRTSPIDWPARRDLAVRAHRAMEHAAQRELPAAVTLIKRIPVGAGLGGGSSDAAGVLLALRDAFGLAFDTPRLRQIGATLGSDVSFFIDDAEPPRPAIVSGFGEHISRLDRRDAAIVLIVPPVSCETRAVYAAFDSQPTAGVDAQRVESLAARSALEALPELFNDLQAAAFRLHPSLREIHTAAEHTASRRVHLTGSGSAMFTLAAHGEAVALAGRLAEALPDCAIVRSRLV